MASLPEFFPLQLARAICWGIDQLVSSHVITALKKEMDCKICALFSHMEKDNACVYPLTGKKPYSILMEHLWVIWTKPVWISKLFIVINRHLKMKQHQQSFFWLYLNKMRSTLRFELEKFYTTFSLKGGLTLSYLNESPAVNLSLTKPCECWGSQTDFPKLSETISNEDIGKEALVASQTGHALEMINSESIRHSRIWPWLPHLKKIP